MRILRATALIATICAGCATAPDPGNPQAPKPTPGPVRHRLEHGTTVVLAPLRLTPPSPANGARAIDVTALEGLIREGLRQSANLDFAGGTESCRSSWRITTTVDASTKALIASLLEVDLETGDAAATAIPLASASFAEQPLIDAIDALVFECRCAVGDQPDVATPSVATIYSANLRCVRLTEDALRDAARGEVQGARRRLELARRADPGCTMTVAALANAMLDAGDAKESTRVAIDTLRHMESRLAPTTRIRLARTLLLARASADRGGNPRVQDDRLLQLGDTMLRERPHDPHATYTRALALNYLRRFEEAAAHLRELRRRWPRVGGVAYHLAFAELASGRPREALRALDDAAGQLSRDVRLLPSALALYHSGEFDELRERLLNRLDSATGRSPRQVHELHRMLASLELLTGNLDAAARHLLDDLDWLRHHPFLLDGLSADVAENGEVLVQLGRQNELGTRIEALQKVATRSTTVAQALTYLAGLVLIEESGSAPTEAMATLNHSRRTVWATLLRAATHHRRGELVDETRELATAVRISESALVRARLSRVLSSLGREKEAGQLLAEMKERMLAIDLRRPMAHPLLNPGRALAFLATRE